MSKILTGSPTATIVAELDTMRGQLVAIQHAITALETELDSRCEDQLRQANVRIVLNVRTKPAIDIPDVADLLDLSKFDSGEVVESEITDEWEV